MGGSAQAAAPKMEDTAPSEAESVFWPAISTGRPLPLRPSRWAVFPPRMDKGWAQSAQQLFREFSPIHRAARTDPGTEQFSSFRGNILRMPPGVVERRRVSIHFC